MLIPIDSGIVLATDVPGVIGRGDIGRGEVGVREGRHHMCGHLLILWGVDRGEGGVREGRHHMCGYLLILWGGR